MTVGPNLVRRGAVYHWRRRLPRSLVSFIGCTHLRISLNTKDSKKARHFGAHLDAMAMDVFSARSTQVMSRAQLAQLFRAANAQHKAKLDLLADIERGRPTSDRSELLAIELARGEAYALLSARGAAAQLDVVAEGRLRAKGLDPGMIVRALQALRDGDGVRFSMAKLTALIEGTGAVANGVNVAKSLPIYLRALAEALLTAPERYGPEPADPLDFAALLKEVSEEGHSEATAGNEFATLSSPVPMDPSLSTSAPASVLQDSEGDAGATDGRVLAIGARLIEKKVNGKDNAALRAAPGRENEARARAKGWDAKAVRQAEGIYDLFNRFLLEECGFDDLSKLRQKHLADFEEFLRRLNRTFGRSPKDRTRTIRELRSIAGPGDQHCQARAGHSPAERVCGTGPVDRGHGVRGLWPPDPGRGRPPAGRDRRRRYPQRVARAALRQPQARRGVSRKSARRRRHVEGARQLSRL